ncbi:methanol dehydrogenase [Sphingomonas sp. Leaf357]|uniref:TPM domain-containing protein n=1 Tax=Sphingomonas sp. Leaf357 TaxID=1736350 RepID=UPI0006F30642|nr:TPM domain-containing protein [Sphingomonas sp. Leaf357]KQS03942.1 methanol dehydrogenase [Sphingomonas sp. Leaf357]
MRHLRLLFALVGLVLIGASPAFAQTFPKFTGLVVDDANVLPANVKADLTAKLQALQKDTNRQLVVATIGDMQGYPKEEYGYKLLRAWGVGLKDVNNGAILFISPNAPAGQRGVRIEVGYGLEPFITDALSSVIINNDMLPRLRAGDIPGAMTAGTDALIQQLRSSPEEAQARVNAAVAEFNKAQPHAGKRSSGVPFGLIFWALIVGFIVLSFFRRRSETGQRYRDADGGSSGGSGILPVVLWSIANEIGNSALRGGGGGGWGGGDDGDSGGGGWGGGGFTGGGGGSGGGGGASGSW